MGGLRSRPGYLVSQGFGRFDAQVEKLAMLGAPQSTFPGMICRLEFRTSWKRKSAWSAAPDVQNRRTPLAMPADDRLRSLNDRQDRASFAPDFAKKRPQLGVE